MRSLLLILIAVLCASCGQLFLKKGMLQKGTIDLSLREMALFFVKVFSSPFVLIGLIAYGIGALLWLVILSETELSYAYPIVSLSYIIVIFGSIILFHEDVSLLRWIGVILICIGVCVVARS